jgi:lipopolysaccharide biosynthesis regulator YciM
MDFKEWEKMKEYEEGRGAYQSAYDAIGKTVSEMFEGIDNYVCEKCHEYFMSGSAQCPECGSWITRKI